MESPACELLKEAMVPNSSWLVQFISVFDGSAGKTACPSYSLDFAITD